MLGKTLGKMPDTTTTTTSPTERRTTAHFTWPDECAVIRCVCVCVCKCVSVCGCVMRPFRAAATARLSPTHCGRFEFVDDGGVLAARRLRRRRPRRRRGRDAPFINSCDGRRPCLVDGRPRLPRSVGKLRPGSRAPVIALSLSKRK